MSSIGVLDNGRFESEKKMQVWGFRFLCFLLSVKIQV